MLLSFENSSTKSEGSTEFAIQNGNLKNISSTHSITYYIEKAKGFVVVWFWLCLQAINDSPFRVGRIGLANRTSHQQINCSTLYTIISDNICFTTNVQKFSHTNSDYLSVSGLNACA